MQVTLDWRECERAANEGVRRHIASMAKGRVPGYHAPADDLWRIHIEGAAGELAVAKALDVYWQAGVNTFQLPDVGKFQVRTACRKGAPLIIRERDVASHTYISVEGTMPRFRLRGFYLGADARRPEWIDRPNPKRPPCWCVPVSELHPMSELR
jgi:hypothetical protein